MFKTQSSAGTLIRMKATQDGLPMFNILVVFTRPAVVLKNLQDRMLNDSSTTSAGLAHTFLVLLQVKQKGDRGWSRSWSARDGGCCPTTGYWRWPPGEG